FIPHRPRQVGPEARAGAVWALGKIHEGSTVAGLVAPLEERLNDATSIPPEDVPVRRMAAVTLGRMKAEKALASLRTQYRHGQPSGDPISRASGWAIERVTGKPVPAPVENPKEYADWFLVPSPRGK